MVNETTDQNIRDSLPMVVKEAIKLEREKTKANIALMVANVDAFLRNYINNHILDMHPTESASSSIPDLQQQLYLKMKDDEQAYNADLPIWLALMYKFKKPASHIGSCRVDTFCSRDHEDHHDDDARPETVEESNLSGSGSQGYQKDFDPWTDVKQRDDYEEVYSKQRIVEVIRVQYDQGYGQEYMKEIVVKRSDVHDYQLGLETYQVKFNITATKLIFPGIEEQKPHTITSLLFVDFIYENSKKEKRVMDIDEIPKFCDKTLKTRPDETLGKLREWKITTTKMGMPRMNP
ncbi:hypothetical protein Tco_1228962 [Tanacetum coccineum]